MPRSQISGENVETLIEFVKQHPLLYDAKSPDHKDAQQMSNTWQSIANIMEIESMDAKDWKNKWRNLRDAYVKKRRDIRASKSGQSAERAKKWKFLDIMSFLDKYVQESSTESNVPSIEPGSDSEVSAVVNDLEDDEAYSITSAARPDSISAEVRPVNPREPRSGSTASSPVPSGGTSTSSRRNRKRRNETNGMEEALTELIKESTKAKQELHKELQNESKKSAEDHFLESCALRMQNLPPTVRSFVQLQISQMFLNAENPEINIPITPLPVTSTPMSTSHPVTYAQLSGPNQAGQQVYDVYDQGSGHMISTAMHLANSM